MVLVVDIGNSRVKWLRVENGVFGSSHQLEHHNDLGCLFNQPGWYEQPVPERILISSVLSTEQVIRVSEWIREHWHCEAEVIRTMRQGYGVTNGYVDYGQLGTDRWAALIAVHQTIPGTVCLFDCGTALTIDVLGGDGMHFGGLIMPGLQMMREALAQKTSALQFTAGDQLSSDFSTLAKDTQSAVTNGTMLNLVAVIDRAMNSFVEELGADIVPVITGGDANVLSPWLEREFQDRPNLVLQGLAIIAGVDV